MPAIISRILYLLADVVSIYSTICLVRLLITWFPGAANSRFGYFLSRICDPYLNYFRRFRFLRLGMLDFSAMAGICLLIAVSNLLRVFGATGHISLGFILANIIGLVWSFVSSLAGFFALFILIRLIAFLIMGLLARNFSRNYNSYGGFWDQIDRILSPIAYKISGFFSTRIISYTKALAISFAVILVLLFAASFLVNILCSFLMSLPI